MSIQHRGIFVVLEGIDRCGKTTQSLKIKEYMETLNLSTMCLRSHFVDRQSETGSLLNKYLKMQNQISPNTLHLIFSANRWELAREIQENLNSGVSIICDRYAYSGAVYSTAAEKLIFEWCLETDRGLPKPDLIIQLRIDPSIVQKRCEYGTEKYESTTLAKLIDKQYTAFHKNRNWVVIDVNNLSIEETTACILEHVDKLLKQRETGNLSEITFLGDEKPWRHHPSN